MSTEENIPITSYLILDTNIFSKLEEDTEIGKQIFVYLKDLLSRSPGWGLIISEFTLFETVNELPIKKEVKMANLLNSFTTFAVDKENLFIAGHLGCLYSDYYKEINITDKFPEPGDKIIGATSLRNNAPICTLNIRDFPAPFFKEILREVFTYNTKKGQVFTVIYIIQPQIKFFEDFYNKRVLFAIPNKNKLINANSKTKKSIK